MNSKLMHELEGIVAVINEKILELKQVQFAKNLPSTKKDIAILEKAKSLVKEVIKGMEAG